MSPTCNLERPGRRQQGATLVELATALAAGMLVVLAALGTLAVLQGNAILQNDASRLQQKLDVALHAMGWQLRQAGAVELRSLPEQGAVSFSTAFDGYGGSGLAVSGEDGRTDVLRVSHQDHADARDCLGNRPPDSVAGVRVDSRFAVTAGELRCLGSHPGTGAQVLIDGVEDFQVRYGLHDGNAADPRRQEMDAQAVGTRWADVRVVHICLQVTGEGRHDAATAASTASLSCKGAPVPQDGRLRRVVRTSFHLRNTPS